MGIWGTAPLKFHLDGAIFFLWEDKWVTLSTILDMGGTKDCLSLIHPTRWIYYLLACTTYEVGAKMGDVGLSWDSISIDELSLLDLLCPWLHKISLISNLHRIYFILLGLWCNVNKLATEVLSRSVEVLIWSLSINLCLVVHIVGLVVWQFHSSRCSY